MGKPLLDYRTLLKALAFLYGENEFDTRTATEDVKNYLYLQTGDPKILKRVTPKLMSNDLTKLYKMGFLRRRKVPRECTNRRGKRYNCGYKYMHRINNQGWSYLAVLEDRKKPALISALSDLTESLTKDLRIGIIKLNMELMAEKGDLGRVHVLHREYTKEVDKRFSSKGFRRFVRGRIIFEKETNCWMALAYLGKEMADLERRLTEREMTIRTIWNQLNWYKEENSRLKTLLFSMLGNGASAPQEGPLASPPEPGDQADQPVEV